EPALRDGRINHALGAELLEESTCHLEGAAEGRDVFAEQNHIRVATHLITQRVRNRLEVGHYAHGVLIWSAKSRRVTDCGSGSGSAAASSIARSTTAAHSRSTSSAMASVQPPSRKR